MPYKNQLGTKELLGVHFQANLRNGILDVPLILHYSTSCYKTFSAIKVVFLVEYAPCYAIATL